MTLSLKSYFWKHGSLQLYAVLVLDGSQRLLSLKYFCNLKSIFLASSFILKQCSWLGYYQTIL